MAQNGLTEDSTGDLLCCGYAVFTPGAGQTYRTNVPVPGFRRLQRNIPNMHRWNGASYDEVPQPAITTCHMSTPTDTLRAELDSDGDSDQSAGNAHEWELWDGNPDDGGVVAFKISLVNNVVTLSTPMSGGITFGDVQIDSLGVGVAPTGVSGDGKFAAGISTGSRAITNDVLNTSQVYLEGTRALSRSGATVRMGQAAGFTALSLYTGNVVRLSIDSSGHVTVAQGLRVGTDADAIAPGDISAGIATTGRGHFFWSANDTTLLLKSLDGTGAGDAILGLQPVSQANYPRLLGGNAAGTNDTDFEINFIGRGRRLHIMGETGTVTVDEQLNTGTTVLAATQGSAAFGLIGGFQFHYSQAAGTGSFLGAAGVTRIVIAPDDTSPQVRIGPSMIGGGTAQVYVNNDILYVADWGVANRVWIDLGTGTTTIAGHARFSGDNARDVGDSGALRPRTGYFGTSLNVGDGVVVTTVNGSINAGDGTRLFKWEGASGKLVLTGTTAAANIELRGNFAPGFTFIPSSGATVNAQMYQVGDLLQIVKPGVGVVFQCDIANLIASTPRTFRIGATIKGAGGGADLAVGNASFSEMFFDTNAGDLTFYSSGSAVQHVIPVNAGKAIIWNERGLDIDYRIEAVGHANAFRVLGSDGAITMSAWLNVGTATAANTVGQIACSSHATIGGSLKAKSQLLIEGDISDTIAAQADNYNPTGLATASVIRITLTGAQTITGLAGGADGRVVVVMNVDTADALTIAHESASSTAANRFTLRGAANKILAAVSAAWFMYDATASRWRLLGNF